MKKIKIILATLTMLALPALASAQSGWDINNAAVFGLPDSTITSIVTRILYWLLGLLGVFGIIGFVIAGILYLVSAGDETTIERAKKAMLWSIVGVIVGLMGFVIIQAVDRMLSAGKNF